MKPMVLSAAAALAAVSVAGSASADLIHALYIFPTAGSLYDDLGTFNTPGGGSVFHESYFAQSDKYSVTADLSGTLWTAAEFNGIEFIDLTPGRVITNVTLDPATNANGVTIDDATFTSNSVSLNFQGQTWDGGQTAVFDITFAPSAVPEPATWALMIVGLLGLGAILRRRSSVATA